MEDGSPYTAIAVDVGLPDGSGLDVLAAARSGAHALTPAAVLSASSDRRDINRAASLDAKYLVKPIEWGTIALFLSDALSLDRRLDIVVRSLHLPLAEADLVRRRALGEDPETIAAARRTSKETLKKQRASAMRRSGEHSFEGLVGRVLRGLARSR